MKRNSTNVTAAVVTGQAPPNWKGTVIQRVIKQKFAPSKSSGKPMITLTTEIISPESVVNPADGKTYDLTGQELAYYMVLSDTTAAGKPWDSLDYIVNKLLPTLGFPAEIDDEAPLKSAENPSGIDFEGKVFESLVSTEERKESMKDSAGNYVPIKDSAGNEITRGWGWKNDMKGILRLASTQPGSTF